MRNQGTGIGRANTWTDTVVASQNEIFGDGDDTILGQYAHQGPLAVGDAYSRSENITLPPAFTGRYRLFVKTDSGNEVFELGLEANNVAVMQQPFDVMPIPYADLVVNSFKVLNSAATGKDLSLRWTVENSGIGSTSVGSWYDAITFSTDSEGRQPIAGMHYGFDHFGHLAIGGFYERTVNVTLPDNLPSIIYAHVMAADREFSRNTVPFEFIFDQNNKCLRTS